MLNKCIIVLCIPCLLSSVHKMDCLREETWSLMFVFIQYPFKKYWLLSARSNLFIVIGKICYRLTFNSYKVC